MNGISNGWFSEVSPEDREEFYSNGKSQNKQEYSWTTNGEDMGGAWPGQAFSLKVNKVLYEGKSKYQQVLVFESATYGNVLVLDGVIQCTERDEFSYQELLAHLPMFAHPNPGKVLIIGGGDGGILREVLKHPSVEQVTMCEIDADVIEVSKKYLTKMACAFSDPKLTLHIGDGHTFLAENKGQFDVIITDSSDPLGPAESLFGEAYYKLVFDSLTENGVLASQGESMWLHLHVIKEMNRFCKAIYPSVAYASGSVSTYPSGVIGFLLCSKDKDNKLNVPSRNLSDSEVEQMQLRYYNSDVHSAVFVLPQFVKAALES